MKKRTPLDVVVLGIVVIIALIVIALSFHNTSYLAESLKINPYLAAGVVEILFGSLLFIRGRQRAIKRNVPMFLEIGYYISFAFVTGVNMYGLAQENFVVGSVVGLAISGAMWLMENTLVWLWTRSHEPHMKSVKDLMKDAKRDIAEEKAIQKIEWMKWEARKPDLKLIQAARRAEEKRKIVTGDDLPEFFQREPDPIQEIIVTPVVEDDPKEPQENQVIPFMRPIGFHQEETKQPKTIFQPNVEARAKAIQIAKQLANELGRIPTKPELMEKGLTDHYSRFARSELQKG